MKNEYSDIYAMIGRLAVELEPKEVKESMVYEASGGRTIHLTELTEKELSMLRKGLRKALEQPAKESRLSNGCKTGTGMKRKRSTVLALLTKYGVNTRDWDAINAFVSHPRIAGKEFAELTGDELDLLRKKMHAILKKGKSGGRGSEFGVRSFGDQSDKKSHDTTLAYTISGKLTIDKTRDYYN